MSNVAVFIDTNVLLESVLDGRTHAEKAQNYLSTHNIVISPLSAHLFAYLGQKDGLKLDSLLKVLSKHRFTDFGSTEVAWAIKNCQDNDFEDALQVACAVIHNAEVFVTFDKKLARKYEEFIPMKVL